MILKPGKLYWHNIGHAYESIDGRYKIYETWLNNTVGYKLIDYEKNEFVSKPSLKECMTEAECRSYEIIDEE